MQAMVFTRPGIMEILDVEPPVASKGEVIIDVAACGICGSELHGIDDAGFRKPPLVMGHEFSGFDPDGRAVAINPILSCGSCDLCSSGRPEVCRRRAIIGIHRAGAFAEQVAVPHSAVFELPVGLPVTAGALVEPLANALHAWNLGGGRSRSTIGILGAGAIGMATLLVAKQFRASVAISDISSERRSMAERLGADHVVEALEGEFDVTVDAVGTAATREASLTQLGPGGTAVWVGLNEPDPRFDARDLVRFEKRVVGSFAYSPREFAEAIEIATQVAVDWADQYPLSEGVRLFYELKAGSVQVVKALLCPTGTDFER
jgi:threonine dehydrogenase-like Zn-dependent dehydrogenase